jgi:DNA-binding transcriptional ArsR family regulator
MASAPSTRKKSPSAKPEKSNLVFAQRMAWFLRNVSDPTGLQILLALTEGKQSVATLCERVSLTEAALNNHLVLLRHAKVVDGHFDGRETNYKLTKPGARLIHATLGLVHQDEPSPQQVLGPSQWKKLVKKVGTVVDDPEFWLNTPNRQFEWRRPIDLIGTEDEDRVHIIIEAAQQGCFA